MKRKQWKIGQQHHKSFPVANARFRPIGQTETGFPCIMDKQPATFGVSFFSTPVDTAEGKEQLQHLLQMFSRKEAEAITWERAYREQKSGHDDESSSYPICVPCALRQISSFLGRPEEECIYLIVGATTTGKSILLFDRNLQRDVTHPSAAVGNFETLDDFRQQYWRDERSMPE
jgi:hypothetical protein